MVNRVRPSLVARPAVCGDRSPELDVGHWRDVRGRRGSHSAVVALREGQAEPDGERIRERLQIRPVDGLGLVPQMREHLTLGSEAPDGAAADRAPAEKRATWIGEDLAVRLRLQGVTVLVHHRGVEIDPTVPRCGYDEADGKGVNDRRKPQVPEGRHCRSDSIERDDEIEVAMLPSFATEEGVDAPSPVHPRVHVRRLERLDHSDGGFCGHHVPTMARMGWCRSPSSSFLS